MIPVEGHKNLYRDEKSGAIINCDITGYNMYKKSKHKKTVSTKSFKRNAKGD